MQVRGDTPTGGVLERALGGFWAGQLDVKERSAGMFLRALGRGCSRKPSEAEVVWGWSVPTSAKATAVVSTNHGYSRLQRPEATLEGGWGPRAREAAGGLGRSACAFRVEGEHGPADSHSHPRAVQQLRA